MINPQRDSIIISLGYCVFFTMVHISFMNWEEGMSKHIVSCSILFLGTILVGTVAGGLVGSFLDSKIPNKIKTWKYMSVLLACNLLAPLCMFLVTRYPYYAE